MGLERHKEFPGIVGGGGSLPHPPCEAKRAIAMACTILPDRQAAGGPSPVCWVLLGVGTHAVAGSAAVFLVTSRSRGHTLTVPDAPVPARKPKP